MSLQNQKAPAVTVDDQHIFAKFMSIFLNNLEINIMVSKYGLYFLTFSKIPYFECLSNCLAHIQA